MDELDAVTRRLLRWRALAVTASLVAVAAVTGLVVLFLGRSTSDGPTDSTELHEMALVPVTFSDLPGWREDDVTAALRVLARSCGAWARRGEEWSLSASGIGGTFSEWRELCGELEVPPSDPSAARQWVETRLAVWEVRDGDRQEGLFTGYYEPTLRGSLKRTPVFPHPLYRRPPELIEVDLGGFRRDLSGRRLAGRVEGGRLEPFSDRAAIAAGALADRGLELAWVDDPVDLFFLHIQGSGRIELAGGGSFRVGYAGQNGHVYRAIGRELIERGELTLEEVSMGSIRAWLAEHPAEARSVLDTNPSFVFFRRMEGEGPVGSLGVELTPERSLAIDRRFLPLGAPVWVATTLPERLPGGGRPWRRLMVAQDTGGAIRGPLRADLYWGPGDRAAAIAGSMRQSGRLWLLLPRGLRPRAGTSPP